MGHTAAPSIILKHVCLMIFFDSVFAKNSNSITTTMKATVFITSIFAQKKFLKS